MFWLKKFVSVWLMPLPFCLTALVLGLVLARSSRWAGRGRRLCILAAALLVLFTNRFISTRLLGSLEHRFAPIPEIAPGSTPEEPLRGCVFVAVLGSGHSDMPAISATGQLSTSGLERLVEAVRILRALPSAQLIVSGPGNPGRPSHAAVLAKAAESLGLDAGRITMVDYARDTEEESVAVAHLTHGERTALVTSAWHMPRATTLFRNAGVNFVPCPADFISRADEHLRISDLGWDCESLVRSTLAVHEWLGLAWLRIRGVS